MASWVDEQLAKPAPSEAIPPLESGDRLTRAEFERRSAAMPKFIKAELIEGGCATATSTGSNCARAISFGLPRTPTAFSKGAVSLARVNLAVLA